MSVDVGIEAGDDAGGLGFDFDFGDGLDLAGGNYGSSDVSALDLGQLRGLELCGVAASGYDHAENYGQDDYGKTSPEPGFPFVFTLRGQFLLPLVLMM